MFVDGATTWSVQANHSLICFAHTDQPSSPVSPTNPIRIYPMQVTNYGTETDLYHAIYVSENGNNGNNGLTANTPVQTVAQALTLAAALPSGDHKVIICPDASTFAEDVAIATPNLILHMPFATIQDYDTLLHSTHANLRRANRVRAGINSYTEVRSCGQDADNIDFAAGAHAPHPL